MFEFIKKNEMDSDRALFANHVCGLIWSKNKGNIKQCLIDVAVVYSFFFEHVRNIYEHVDSKIPLFALYELQQSQNAPHELDMDGNEFQSAIKRTMVACREYYGA